MHVRFPAQPRQTQVLRFADEGDDRLVMATTLANAAPAESPDPQLQAAADRLPLLLASGRRDEAQELLAKLLPDQHEPLATILDDLITALSRN